MVTTPIDSYVHDTPPGYSRRLGRPSRSFVLINHAHYRATVRRRSAVLAVVCIAVQIVGAPTALAESKPSKLDAARASAKQIKAELQAVTKRIEVQQAKSVSARQAVAAANGRLQRARAEEVAVAAQLDRVRASVRDLAIREYMRSGPGSAAAALGVDPAKFARGRYLRSIAFGSNADLQDALRSARQDAEGARGAAQRAAGLAASRKQIAGDTLNALRASQSRQLNLAAAAEARLDAAIKESEAIRRIRPRVSRIGPSGSSGSSRRGAVSLTTVRGITVATEIAGQLDRMLSAADADGVRFGGSGYRSPDGQVAARRRNCGSSSYDVYDKPASQCRPPTARPGQSMHEQGLAVDFTYNGSLIQSRSSEGFQWLKANAARFGFYNLPSEAWHWSVNGN